MVSIFGEVFIALNTILKKIYTDFSKFNRFKDCSLRTTRCLENMLMLYLVVAYPPFILSWAGL
jgi:hypothetical protein